VLLHFRSGGTSWIGSSGVAELGSDLPPDPEGSFRVGSVTKTFTAVVVLQLVGEGRLRLDEPVGRWVPGMPNAISLRQLLNHTSGLYNYTDDLPDPAGLVRDRYLHHEPSEAVQVGLDKPRLFEPGSSWSYSNTNYIVLGLVIEAVTGNSYADEVDERILRPLALPFTFVPGDEVWLPEPHAHPYLTIGDDVIDTAKYNTSQAWSAGAVVSTAPDLNRFYTAVMDGELLEEAEQQAMMAAVPVDDGYSYGLGIERRLVNGHTLWGHTGGIFGYLTLSYHSDDVQLTLSYTGTSPETPETSQLLAGLLSD
jgi:D-alanyl-D-alanine carboxypeptidase